MERWDEARSARIDGFMPVAPYRMEDIPPPYSIAATSSWWTPCHGYSRAANAD